MRELTAQELLLVSGGAETEVIPNEDPDGEMVHDPDAPRGGDSYIL